MIIMPIISAAMYIIHISNAGTYILWDIIGFHWIEQKAEYCILFLYANSLKKKYTKTYGKFNFIDERGKNTYK